MDILCKHVGVVEAEKFVYLLRTEEFDYTKWQRDHFDKMTEEEIDKAVEKHSQERPFKGEKAVII